MVHARGAAAHGYFEASGSAAEISKAGLFAKAGKQTPVFLRFSTVVGSRGSADTPRDVRGFAIKFYTEEGIWDLVGNNMPVFFIQDAIKFPDFVHAVKPEPHREIPQAASAHDTFWDFVSLTPESTHVLMWVRVTAGFRGATQRWKASASTRSDSSTRMASRDSSSFTSSQRRASAHSFGMRRRRSREKIQTSTDATYGKRSNAATFPKGNGRPSHEEKDEMKFDFDLLDPTKLIPEELVPIQKLGKLVLTAILIISLPRPNRWPFTSAMSCRASTSRRSAPARAAVSYLDTQLKRVGPNFAQLPINRPTCPMHNNQRDGRKSATHPQGTGFVFPQFSREWLSDALA